MCSTSSVSFRTCSSSSWVRSNSSSPLVSFYVLLGLWRTGSRPPSPVFSLLTSFCGPWRVSVRGLGAVGADGLTGSRSCLAKVPPVCSPADGGQSERDDRQGDEYSR